MAGVGETATVGALFALAGQVLQTTIVLYNFIKAYRKIHLSIQDIAQELYCLYLCLSEVQKAASYARSGTGPPPPCLEAICASLRGCYERLQKIESQLDLVKKKRSLQSVVKRLKIAAEKDYFLRVSGQLSIKRQELLLLLSTSSW